MAVREFELFHGIVLTKLLRNERPVALRMIETNFEDWSTYTVNDEVKLVVKHSANPRYLTRGEGGVSWTFNFTLEQLRQLQSDPLGKPVYAALVGGCKDVKSREMQVCLLDGDEINRVLDVSSGKPVTLTVRCKPRKELEVVRRRVVVFRVPRLRLDNWEVPGS